MLDFEIFRALTDYYSKETQSYDLSGVGCNNFDLDSTTPLSIVLPLLKAQISEEEPAPLLDHYGEEFRIIGFADTEVSGRVSLYLLGDRSHSDYSTPTLHILTAKLSRETVGLLISAYRLGVKDGKAERSQQVSQNISEFINAYILK